MCALRNQTQKLKNHSVQDKSAARKSLNWRPNIGLVKIYRDLIFTFRKYKQSHTEGTFRFKKKSTVSNKAY